MPARQGRIERLETWLAAIARHVPGEIDDPARTIAAFSSAQLTQITIDLPALGALVRNPKENVFFAGLPTGRSVQVFYTREELIRLRTIADTMSRRGGIVPVLKRGAVLHTDLAMLTPALDADPKSRDGTHATTVFMDDGRRSRIDRMVGHWEIARVVLGQIKPSPAGDPAVRAWYVATVASMLGQQQLTLPHFAAAVALFPDDPDVRFLDGCLHELLATVAIQEVVRTTVLSDASFQIGSRDEELKRAEAAFRSVVRRSPNHVEARVHWGRVLMELERPAPALRELRRALPLTPSAPTVVSYFAALFLGDAAMAAGHDDEARAAYNRALALFPRAQSPRLALGQMLVLRGERQIAAAQLHAFLAGAGDRSDEDDPWLGYSLSAGRQFATLLANAFAVLTAE